MGLFGNDEDTDGHAGVIMGNPDYPYSNDRPTTFTLKINLENAAFEDSHELASILRKLADKFGYGSDSIKKFDGGKIMDVNGNSVGKWELV